MMKIKKYIISILLILIFQIILSGEATLYYINKPDPIISEKIYKQISFTKSFIVSYINGDCVSFYGYKSNLDTKYDIASVTKTFTALVLLQLHDEGKLSLDDKVNKYINYYDSNVTIRHLLSHTSFYPYGRKYSYSNLNYVECKKIIEVVTRMSYNLNISNRILDPLDMSETTAKYSNGAGGIISTTRDLSKYCKMLMNKGRYNNHSVITDNVYNMITDPTKELGVLTYYRSSGGYEVFTDMNKKILSFYKSGRWYESVSGIEIYPDQNKALIYLGDPGDPVGRWVLDWRNRVWRYIRKLQ